MILGHCRRRLYQVDIIAVFILAQLLLTTPQNICLALNITINPGENLSGNIEALEAFHRAARVWESRLSDDIAVTIEAEFKPMGDASVIGSTAAVQIAGGYDLIRNAMVADAANSVSQKDLAAEYLPTRSDFDAILPSGFTFSGSMVATKANLKALGFDNLDTMFGNTDASITFNAGYQFDYDPIDGIGASMTDFETLAAHEIGHVLGFISVVDTIDTMMSQGLSDSVEPRPLDLFRFVDGVVDPTLDPSIFPEFSSYPRNLTPGLAATFDYVVGEVDMSTGSFNGDSRQASHWKDNNLTGTYVGIMDPTLSRGQSFDLSAADLQALDLIGYDISTAEVPIPVSLVLFATGLGSMMLYGKRRNRTLR